MPTESDKIVQNDTEAKLTARQAKFLPVLLAGPTYTAACKKGRVSRDTLYAWLKEPTFKAELDRQRNELVGQGFALLSQSVTKAVEVLVGLLDGSDGRLKRLTANDIISHSLRHKELVDIEERIGVIEERLRKRR